MNRFSLAILLVSLATLMTEMLFIRVFDVILIPNVGYVVVSCAMFAVGVAGAWAALRPRPPGDDLGPLLARLSGALAVVIVLTRPALNATPLLYEQLPAGTLRQLVALGLIYSVILIPFLVSGLFFAYLFSGFASQIRRLYFFDLAGAGLGCVLWLPFLESLGPGGLLFWAAAACTAATATLAGGSRTAILAAVGLVVLPALMGHGELDFVFHKNKRGLETAKEEGRVEFSRWDPISRIDVVDNDSVDDQTGEITPRFKHIAYDGGSQSSHFFPFDGDFTALRRDVLDPSRPPKGFWHRGVLASHYLKRDTGAEVLVFGSAGGREIRAALAFEPSRVEGVELVGTVVELGLVDYADYIGDIFNDPRVNLHVDEARSWLQRDGRRYDIIQIFSNHLSSNIAVGIGASMPNYLQTAEAYREYMSQLKSDGILHVNHHFFPRIVTTAARAWQLLGLEHFQHHVVVFERESLLEDTLPTILIKMSPWTQAEIEELVAFFALPDANAPAQLVVDPLRPQESFLSSEFFAGDPPPAFRSKLDYRIESSTDDWPYFGSIEKHGRTVETDRNRFLNASMTSALNGRSRSLGGEHRIFWAVGIVGLACSLLLILAPLLISTAGRVGWSRRLPWLSYFACLGAGFIIIELALVQIVMKLIGYPVHAFAVVIFTLLLAAASGSLASERLGVSSQNRWHLPFVGILIAGIGTWLAYPSVIDFFLPTQAPVRILVAVLLVFPIGFFLGMPFPLGVLCLRHQPHGAIAWAWGMNGVFTVIGGVLCAVLSIEFGFRLTLLVALGIYALAFLLILHLVPQMRAT